MLSFLVVRTSLLQFFTFKSHTSSRWMIHPSEHRLNVSGNEFISIGGQQLG